MFAFQVIFIHVSKHLALDFPISQMNSLSNFQFQSGETMGVHVGNSVDDVYVAGEGNGADNHDNDGYSDDSDKSSSSEVALQSSKGRRFKTGAQSG